LPGATTDLYQTGFDASWEIDVFGGKRRQVEAATAQVQVAAESRHALQVSLAAETARDYLQLRGSQERLRIARENLAAQKDALELTRSKRSVGLASDLDVARAAAEVAATESTLGPLEAAARMGAHALSILLGQEPGSLNAELENAQAVPAAPPEVPVGLPSQLLTRRADIKEAERQIAAATARVGAARADLFPKFALIATAGLDSSSPGNLFSWDSRYFLISPTVAWRIFDAGRILSNIRLQQTGAEEATLQYRNTILVALREVEDALVNYATERSRRIHLAEEFKQDQQALDLARQQYEHGLSDFLGVLDAERSVYAAQDSLAMSDVTVSTDLVALYKALGGGWK
jgi:NodT family efflux transporter outer membrane factor (OMF) lipoprotein